MSDETKQEKLERLKAKVLYYEIWIKTISEICATTVDADYLASKVVNDLGFDVVYLEDSKISLKRK